MKLSNKIITVPAKLSKGAIAGIVAAVVVVGGCVVAYAYSQSNDELPPDTNEQMAIDQMEALKDESVDMVVNDLEIPWADMGYASFKEYQEDINSLHENAKGMAENAVAKYSSVITDEQKKLLEQHEATMTSCISPDEYEKAIGKFNEIVADLESKLNPPAPEPDPEPVVKPDNNDGNDTSKPVTKPDNSGGYSTPYNFKYHGVLHETNWRWTYYSSRVLYHYMTPQWWCDEDGIWRDSNGYAIVACDSKPQGTVIDTELFGKCIVMDCGVGNNHTLDLYVNW